MTRAEAPNSPSVMRSTWAEPPDTLTTVDQLNAWDILRNRTLVVTRAGMEKLLA